MKSLCSFTDGDCRLGNTALAAITSMKKLCNHPDLLWEKVKAREPGYKELDSLYPQGHDPRSVFVIICIFLFLNKVFSILITLTLQLHLVVLHSQKS